MFTLTQKKVTSYEEAFNLLFPTATCFSYTCTLEDSKVKVGGLEAGNLGAAVPKKLVYTSVTDQSAAYYVWCTDSGGTGLILAPNHIPFVWDKNGTIETGEMVSPYNNLRCNITTIGRTYNGICLPLWTMGIDTGAYDMRFYDMYVLTYSTNIEPYIGEKLDTDTAQFEVVSMCPGTVDAGYTPQVLIAYRKK